MRTISTKPLTQRDANKHRAQWGLSIISRSRLHSKYFSLHVLLRQSNSNDYKSILRFSYPSGRLLPTFFGIFWQMARHGFAIAARLLYLANNLKQCCSPHFSHQMLLQSRNNQLSLKLTEFNHAYCPFLFAFIQYHELLRRWFVCSKFATCLSVLLFVGTAAKP